MQKWLISLIAFFIVSQVAFAGDDGGLSVRGECLVDVPTDRGSLVLTVKQRSQNPGTAAQMTQEKFNKLSARVRQLSLKDLKLRTQSFQVTEEFDYSNGKQISKGHLASQSLEIETSEPAKLSAVLKLASEEKVEEVGQLQIFSSFAATKAAQESCLDSAFKNAKEKAEKLARAAGQRLGKALQIEEVLESSVGPVRPMFAKTMMAAEVTPGSGGEIHTRSSEVRIAVQVQFELN